MAAALWLILAVLLFGSGAVLGLFSWIFWIIVAVAGLVLVIWFVASLPRMGKSIVEEDIEATKKAYRNHPTLTAVFWALLALFFVWLITALQQPSETAGINTEPQAQHIPDAQPTQYEEPTTTTSFDVEAAMQAGYSTDEIRQYLAEHPNTRVYPDVNRNAFLSSCHKEIENDPTACTCLLNYFEASYSLDEFAEIEAKYVERQTSKAIADAVAYCTK